MCELVTGTAMLLAGGALAAGGKLFEGFASSSANTLQAKIARFNADTLMSQANIEQSLAELPLLKGAFEEGRVRRAGERALGSQVAGYASAGFDPTVGSPLLSQASSAAHIELDAGLIDAQAHLDRASALSKVARTLGSAASQYGSAGGYLQRASDAVIAGILGAGSTLMLAGSKAWPGLGGTPVPAGGGSTSMDVFDTTGNLYG